MRLLLASRSPARRETLLKAGITPIVTVADVDEDAVLQALIDSCATPPTPAHQVTTLAAAKCQAVTTQLHTTPALIHEVDAAELLVIACDSMLEIGGRMLGKPHTPDLARTRIREMRGTVATLWTGHAMALMSADPEAGTYHLTSHTEASASTRVIFADMSDEEIDAYVATGEPLHVAGSFTIDGLGGPFIAGVEGDHHSVVGISLPLARQMAAELGVFWPDLWDVRRTSRS